MKFLIKFTAMQQSTELSQVPNIYHVNTGSVPKSSYQEFVMGMVGLIMLFFFVVVMSGWLIPIQVLREENSEIIITPFPAEYEDYGADKVVRPCAVPIYTSEIPGTFQCTYTPYYWEEGIGSVANETIIFDAYCPEHYDCHREWDYSTKTSYIAYCFYSPYDGISYHYEPCSYGCQGQDFINMRYFGPDARQTSFGYSAAPVTLFIVFSFTVLVVIFVVLAIQYKNRQSENTLAFNIALGLAFLLGGAVIAVFGGIALLVHESDHVFDELSGSGIDCIASSMLREQLMDMVQFSSIYIGAYSIYLGFYCLIAAVVVAFFVYYIVSSSKGNSVSTVVVF